MVNKCQVNKRINIPSNALPWRDRAEDIQVKEVLLLRGGWCSCKMSKLIIKERAFIGYFDLRLSTRVLSLSTLVKSSYQAQNVRMDCSHLLLQVVGFSG
jgi:hypothetical protein